MNTPAFMPCNRCISIHLAGLNCLPCKLAPRAAEILSQPPTQTEGGRAQGRWTVLVTQSVVSCAQYQYCPCCCLFCNWNQEGSRCLKGAALKLWGAWFCLSRELERSDPTALLLSLSPGQYSSTFPSCHYLLIEYEKQRNMYTTLPQLFSSVPHALSQSPFPKPA